MCTYCILRLSITVYSPSTVYGWLQCQGAAPDTTQGARGGGGYSADVRQTLTPCHQSLLVQIPHPVTQPGGR